MEKSMPRKKEKPGAGLAEKNSDSPGLSKEKKKRVVSGMAKIINRDILPYLPRTVSSISLTWAR